jgi:hypothetical protein
MRGRWIPPSAQTGDKVGLIPRPEMQLVLEDSTVTPTASPSNLGDARPPLNKVHTKGCLSSSTRYAHVGCYMLSM